MSILINGMKMPKEDEELCIRICPSGKVTIYMDLQCRQIAEAVELPDHGDLIDRDAIKVGLWGEDEYKMLCDSPVVIPAERE